MKSSKQETSNLDILIASNEKAFRKRVLKEVLRYSKEHGKKATAKKLGISKAELKADIKTLHDDFYSLCELVWYASALDLNMHVTFY